MSTSDLPTKQSPVDTSSPQTQSPGLNTQTEQQSMRQSPGSVARRLLKNLNSSAVTPMAADSQLRVKPTSQDNPTPPMGYTGGSVVTE